MQRDNPYIWNVSCESKKEQEVDLGIEESLDGLIMFPSSNKRAKMSGPWI